MTHHSRLGSAIRAGGAYAMWAALDAIGTLLNFVVRLVCIIGLLAAALIWLGLSDHPESGQWIAVALGAVGLALLASALFGMVCRLLMPRE